MPESKYFVVSTPDASATLREIEAQLRDGGFDLAAAGENVLRYFQPPRSAVGEVYIAEGAARLLEERGVRPGVLRYSVPARDVPAEARTATAPTTPAPS